LDKKAVSSPSNLYAAIPSKHDERNRSCSDTRTQPVYTSSHGVKARSLEHRKLLDNRIGRVEYLVLEYAITRAENFTPSMVVIYAWEKYGIRFDRRRVYDAIQRLVKKDILLKESRGWYALNPDLSISKKDLEQIVTKAKRQLEYKEVDKSNTCKRNKDDEWGPREWVRDPVARVHVSFSGPVDLLAFYSICIMALRILGVAVKCLFNYLRELGYSIRKLREAKRRAIKYVGKVGGCIIGGHSLYGGGESKTLIPVQKLEKVKYRELGVDIKLDANRAPKIHVKIYTAKNPYRHQSLTEYMKLEKNRA